MRKFIRKAAPFVVFAIVGWMGRVAIVQHLTEPLAIYVLFAAITLAVLTDRLWPSDWC
jgi:hypothetical protein